jgi:hypothetical protein
MQKVASTFPSVDVLLKTSLDLLQLEKARVINDAQGIKSKITKVRSVLLWKQQKYNLLREESEGFSKLAVLLGSLPSYPEDPSHVLQSIRAAIGHFDLDANRALDLTLDAFEQEVGNLNFVKVLQLFRGPNIGHMLGFKFEQYHTPPPPPATTATATSADTKATVDATKATVGASASKTAQSGSIIYICIIYTGIMNVFLAGI